MADAHKVRGTAATCLLVCLSWLGAICLFLGVFLLVYGYWGAARIDPEDRCTDDETDTCFSDRSGMVQALGSGDAVTIAHDDGRKRMTVYLQTASPPPPRTRVRIETWEAQVVSIYIPEQKRRIRTTLWPQRWDPLDIGIAAFGAVALASSIAIAIRTKRF